MIDTRVKTKHIIAELSVAEKVCLYNALYKDLASKGIGGDTELAHVNTAEMVLLRTMGGSGTINPNTGLIQFMGGGGSPPAPPSSTTQSQTSEFPEELKPYIKDVLSKSQAIQEKREAEGYIPYEGPQIAEFTPEQEQAFTGIQGMVGKGQEYFDPSAQLAASSARAPTDQEISGYMSPYMQQVVDIQKREAERQGDVAQQQLATQAVGAGGFGGSRMAILEAEQNRNLQTQLGDIQARGTAAAYEDAQARLAAQRQRELAGSSQFMNLGTTAPQQQLKELTAVEAIGAQKQAQSQQALNIAKDQFGQEQTFPEQTLQQYQSVIRGFPLAPTTYTNTQTVNPAPSYLQQAAGLGGLGLGVASAFGGFGKGSAQGGLVSRMHGGPVDQNRGLGSIVVKKQAGTKVGDIDITAMPIDELRRLRDKVRMTDAGKADIYDLEIKKRITGNPEATITAFSKPVIKPLPVVSSEPPKETPIPAIGTPITPPLAASAPPKTKSDWASLASLRNNEKRDAYFSKATEVLGNREKRILAKMDDPSDKYEYLAGLLSGIAGGTPGAGLGQLATEVAPKALAGAKELRKDREGLQEKAEDTSLQIGKLGAEQEAADKELESKVYIALQKDKVSDTDRANILEKYLSAVEKSGSTVDEKLISTITMGITDPNALISVTALLRSKLANKPVGADGKELPGRNTNKAAVAAKVSQ
jgi:hypothetical protein